MSEIFLNENDVEFIDRVHNIFVEKKYKGNI